MSGGVDSSTTAAILKDQGHDVIGIGLKLPGTSSLDSDGSCCGIAAMDDARRVAAKIDIPFQVLNYETIFEENVIDYFCRSYLEGKTPNPCVECNRSVKFGRLLEFAESVGAEQVATGHYARVYRDDTTGRHILKKGTDPENEQSYFLYSLSQEQLARAVFPLGEKTKEETRQMARDFGLKVSEKPGSQDICFLGEKDYRQFLTERFPESVRPGPVVDSSGNVLGQHEGIVGFTIGQRRGVGVAAGIPLYVLSVDPSTSTVVVGKREEMLRDRIAVGRVNWIAVDEPGMSLDLTVRIRYRQSEMPAAVSRLDDDRAEIVFANAQTVAAAPGQSAVFYDGDSVVGGGIIE